MIAKKQRIHYAGQWRKAENGFMASSCACGNDHKNGAVIYAGGTQWHDKGAKAIVQPVWEYPDDYCKTQTQEFDMEPAGANCGISSNVRQGSHFECAGSNSCSCASLVSGCFHFCSNFGRTAVTGHEAAYSSSGIGEG